MKQANSTSQTGDYRNPKLGLLLIFNSMVLGKKTAGVL